ncbi:MAG: hypothetical protein NVS3B26_24770 [Mycobacteriales bacterium]
MSAHVAARVAGRYLALLASTGAVQTALQPDVHLSTGRLVGVEARARFEDGRTPHVWFGEADTAGLAADLDLLAFELAVETLDVPPNDVLLSVNAFSAS